MAVKVVVKPKLNTKWKARNGKHAGIEVIVIKIGNTTVGLRPANGHLKNNRILGRGTVWRLPLDAFYRRYVQM